MKTQFPEHEKLKAVVEKSQCCGEFIEWLNMRGFFVRSPCKKAFNLRKSLAEFFEINEQILEKEKQEMLNKLKGE